MLVCMTTFAIGDGRLQKLRRVTRMVRRPEEKIDEQF